jgi:xanthine dehydrogenase accessory factor
MELFRAALESVEPVALVTVIATSGSTPRHPGAQMLVDRAGVGTGTIGGGRVELEACRAGAEVAAGGAPRRVKHHLVRDLAMCCGGSMELWIEPVAPSRAALARAIELVAARRAAALIHPLDGRPLEVLEGDAGRRPRLEGERFVQPLRGGERAILFGCGHVSRALGPMLVAIGFEVIVCDDGDTGALEPPPGFAARVIESFERTDVERALGPLGDGDHVVVLTRDHAIDQRILEAWLPHGGLSYLGVIGSRGKIARFKQRLEHKGVATPERWARVSGPIGLPLGGETPAEIAIAVAAELILRRSGGATEAPR